MRNPTELKSIKNISLLRQQTNPVQPVQNSSSLPNQNTLNKQEQSDLKNVILHQHCHNQLAPNDDINNIAWLQQQVQPAANNTQKQHMHHLPPRIIQLPPQQQQQYQQNPPSSPRVLALNGAFHKLTTSSPIMTQTPSPNNGNYFKNDFKMEPNMDADDLPTDLSTNSADRKKYTSDNIDCYP